MSTRDTFGNLTNEFSIDQAIVVQFEFDLTRLHENLFIAFDLSTADGVVLFRSHHTDDSDENWPEFTVGRNTIRCIIPPNLLKLSTYLISARIGLHFGSRIVYTDPLLAFTVIDGRPNSRFWRFRQNRPEVIAPVLPWQGV